ncbi:MAG: potassium channel family protein [Casimicrobiaceae bacterium]
MDGTTLVLARIRPSSDNRKVVSAEENAVSHPQVASIASAQTSLGRLQGSWLGRLRNVGMAGLLALLGFGIFVLPVIARAEADITLASKILLTLVLVCGLTAIVEHRRIVFLLAALSAVAILARLLDGVLPARALVPWHDALLLVALIVLAIAIAINVFASRRAVGDRLFGAIALYLLLGLIWALMYAIVAATTVAAFAGQLPTDQSLFRWGYFSLVTLTTLGYGDITPVTHVARSLAALEALIGQLYPAIIIARLVSAQKPQL